MMLLKLLKAPFGMLAGKKKLERKKNTDENRAHLSKWKE